MGKKIIKTPTTIMHHIYLADMAGCGYLRCIFPSMLLSQYKHDNRINFMPSYGLHFINDINFYSNQLFIMFQRSATDQQLKIIKYIKKNYKKQTNTPLIYEIDDLLINDNIPKWNFASKYYNKYSKTAIEIMKEVDAIIVSTNKLKEIYSQYNSKIEVQQNHLPKFLWNEPQWKDNSNKKFKIVWAGSGNHFSNDKNIKGGDFGNKLINFIIKTSDDYEWNIIGGCPIELKNNDKIIKHKWMDIFNYPNYLKSLNIDLGIAPLEQNLFNECKSNIKAKEYTAAGIPAIYTDIYPYKNLKMKAKTDEEMISMIEDTLKNKKLEKIWNSDYNTLENNLFWETNNNLIKYYNKLIGLFNFKLPK
jgi:O-antigen biosynthesis protein